MRGQTVWDAEDVVAEDEVGGSLEQIHWQAYGRREARQALHGWNHIQVHPIRSGVAIVGKIPGRLESNRRWATAVGVETGKHAMQRTVGGRRGERTSQMPTGGVNSMQLGRARQQYLHTWMLQDPAMPPVRRETYRENKEPSRRMSL